jgi:hypothetical protein
MAKTTNYTLPTKPELEDAYQALWATLQNKLGPYFSDYGQLVEKGSPLNNQYQQLKSNISQHIPSNADFSSPQRMSEWAQAAALNAPMGLTLKGAPPTKFSRAHKLAQKNAALPIEQGGLGLPPNNTAMDRARAMGFDTAVYHGQSKSPDFFGKEKDLSNIIENGGNAEGGRLFTSDNPAIAAKYAGHRTERPTIYPLSIRSNDILESSHAPGEKLNHVFNSGINEADRLNKGTVVFKEVIDNPSYDPMREWASNVYASKKGVRSRFAAFDPLNKDSANILASILGATTLAGMYGKEQEQPTTLRSVMEKKLKK